MKTVKATMRVELTMRVPDEADEEKVLASVKMGSLNFKPAYGFEMTGVELIETDFDADYQED